jgi:replicative DNA helicase
MRAREKFIPALVIVDYLTLMITNGRWVSRPGERYEVLGQICKELISLAQRYHVPVWLLHQATRGAKKKHTVDLDDSADSLEPMRDADMILTLNQDIEEAQVKKLRIFLAGGRKAKDRRTAHVIIERELCHIIGERVSDEDAIAADVEATPDPEVK